MSYHDVKNIPLLTVLSEDPSWNLYKDFQACLRFLENVAKIITENRSLGAEGSLWIFTILARIFKDVLARIVRDLQKFRPTVLQDPISVKHLQY